MERIIAQVLKNTDNRIRNRMRVNPAFLFAAMFWYPLPEMAQKSSGERSAYYDAFALAMNDVLMRPAVHWRSPSPLPRLPVIFGSFSYRDVATSGKRASKLMEHPKFRAAFDLLELRAQVENNTELQRSAQWWPSQAFRRRRNKKDASTSWTTILPHAAAVHVRANAPRREGTV